MGSKSNKNRKTNNNKGTTKKSNKVTKGTELKKIVKNKNFKWAVIFSVIIVVIVVIAAVYPYIAPFSAPSSIKPGKYYEISNKDLLNNGSSAVFFISWYGCPIGATDSWPLYLTMNKTTDISSHVRYNTADPTDIYGNGSVGQPGLLFNGNFTFKNNGTVFSFHPLYMFNKTMTGTVKNKTIPETLVSYGLSLINSTYPSNVAKMFNKYATSITFSGHLTTTFIITGPHGTYIFNTFMYQPGNELGTGTWSSTHNTYRPFTPQYVMSNLKTDSSIDGAASTFSSYLGKAK